MSSWSSYRIVSCVVAGLMVGGCAAAFDPFARAPLRAGTGLPDRFDPPPSRPRIQPADTLPGDGCLSPMRDPRDGTEIRFVRSSTLRADYAVPNGQYGVAADELLRLDCNTGEPIGVVRR